MASGLDATLYASRTERTDMEHVKRSLLAFTVISQMSVGMFASAAIAAVIGDEVLSSVSNATTFATLITAAIFLFLLSLLFSIAHIDRPRLFLTMARNWRNSWLSREGVFAVIFLILLLGYVLFQSQLQTVHLYFQVYLALAMISGVGFVGAQAMIYKLESRPSWNSPYTLTSFFATTVATGPLAVATFLAVELLGGAYGHVVWDPLTWLTHAASVLLILTPVQLLLEITYLADLKASEQEARASYEIHIGRLRNFLVSRLGLRAASLGLSGVVFVLDLRSLHIQVTAMMILALFATVLLAEFVGRYAFYYGVVPLNPGVRYVQVLGSIRGS